MEIYEWNQQQYNHATWCAVDCCSKGATAIHWVVWDTWHSDYICNIPRFEDKEMLINKLLHLWLEYQGSFHLSGILICTLCNTSYLKLQTICFVACYFHNLSNIPFHFILLKTSIPFLLGSFTCYVWQLIKSTLATTLQTTGF